MPSMIIIFTLIGITLLIFAGRFYEILQSKFRDCIRFHRIQVKTAKASTQFTERKAA